MNAALAPLLFWHGIIVVYAALLGIEPPVLLFVALYKRRPWRERLLVAVPTAAFVWALWLARSMQAYNYWQSYLRFQLDHYPAIFAQHLDLDGAQRAVADASRLGWTVGIVTTALLILGWGVALRWLAPGSEKTGTPVMQDPPADGAESGDLEITVEPIDRVTRASADE